MSDFHKQGQAQLFAVLGITKMAVPIIPKAPLLRRATGWLKKKLPEWGRSAKEMAVGRPGQFVDELSRGKAFSKGSLVRQSFHAPGVLNKVFWYGFPAYEGAKIMTGDEPDKAARMGGLLGGTAMGIGAWRPLGILGSIGAGMVGERVGAGVGSTARHLAKGPEIQSEGRWNIPAAHPAAQPRQALSPYPQGR